MSGRWTNIVSVRGPLVSGVARGGLYVWLSLDVGISNEKQWKQ